MPHDCLARVKSRLPSQPLLAGQDFPAGFGQSRGYCLKVFCLVGWPFLHPLARESRFYFFLSFLTSAPFGISGLPASLAPSLRIYEREKKTGNLPPYCCLGPKASSQSDFSPPFSLLMFVLYIMSHGFVVLRVHLARSRSPIII